LHKPDMSEVLNMYGIKLNRNKKAICPFHNEKTASLSIKGKIYNCFGCDTKGDAIDFVMRIENCDFKEALKILNIGDERQIKEPKEKAIKRKREEKRVKKYWEAYKQFAKFDKFCTENKPKRYQEPTRGWYMCNEAREIWWERLQKLN